MAWVRISPLFLLVKVAYPFEPGTIPPTPARMCTVSHCHQILPGFYRFKRCEQHRLQNRYHSKLKRVREKVDGDKPDDKEEGVEIPRHMMENGLEIKGGEEGGDGDVGGQEGFLVINPLEGSLCCLMIETEHTYVRDGGLQQLPFAWDALADV